jgi:DNA-binding protein H-NS
MRGEKNYTPAEISKMSAERTLSDAEKIKGGAKYDENGVLDFSKTQKDEAFGLMSLDSELDKKMQSLEAQLATALNKKNYAEIARVSKELENLAKMKENDGISSAIKSIKEKKEKRYSSPKPESSSGKGSVPGEGLTGRSSG